MARRDGECGRDRPRPDAPRWPGLPLRPGWVRRGDRVRSCRSSWSPRRGGRPRRHSVGGTTVCDGTGRRRRGRRRRHDATARRVPAGVAGTCWLLVPRRRRCWPHSGSVVGSPSRRPTCRSATSAPRWPPPIARRSRDGRRRQRIRRHARRCAGRRTRAPRWRRRDRRRHAARRRSRPDDRRRRRVDRPRLHRRADQRRPRHRPDDAARPDRRTGLVAGSLRRDGLRADDHHVLARVPAGCPGCVATARRPAGGSRAARHSLRGPDAVAGAARRPSGGDARGAVHGPGRRLGPGHRCAAGHRGARAARRAWMSSRL